MSTWKNTLYCGDNLNLLRDLPSESTDLCYIDPPFNSQRTYNQIYSTSMKLDKAQAQAFLDTWVFDQAASVGLKEILGNERGLLNSETIDLVRGLRAVLKESGMLAYLVSMVQRFIEIHRVLKPTGSFYLHCDPTASHYLKVVLDSIFEPENFRSEITWKTTNVHNDAKTCSPVADAILYYVADSCENDRDSWLKAITVPG